MTDEARQCAIAVFFRAEGFYPIALLDPAECGKTLGQQAADHAELNPGTLRVEDINGAILWRPILGLPRGPAMTDRARERVMGLYRNRPTPEGLALGKALARMCDNEAVKNPDAPARCATCAFRAGEHLANNSPETLMTALKCALERKPFWCHHVPDGKARACAGWRLLLAETSQEVPWPLIRGKD